MGMNKNLGAEYCCCLKCDRLFVDGVTACECGAVDVSEAAAVGDVIGLSDDVREFAVRFEVLYNDIWDALGPVQDIKFAEELSPTAAVMRMGEAYSLLTQALGDLDELYQEKLARWRRDQD